jgi:hypothetical protein
MLELGKDIEEKLLKIYADNGVMLEGNIIKLIKPETSDFAEYLKTASDKDKENRRKRLEITKQIQSQNRDLIAAQEQNMSLMDELRGALKKAEDAKNNAENDLDILQKKTQFELIGSIIKVALWIIIGVGIITSLLYFIALMTNKDTKILESAWSNMFGILLTNSFSIIGTIMGVKYASKEDK